MSTPKPNCDSTFCHQPVLLEAVATAAVPNHLVGECVGAQVDHRYAHQGIEILERDRAVVRGDQRRERVQGRLGRTVVGDAAEVLVGHVGMVRHQPRFRSSHRVLRALGLAAGSPRTPVNQPPSGHPKRLCRIAMTARRRRAVPSAARAGSPARGSGCHARSQWSNTARSGPSSRPRIRCRNSVSGIGRSPGSAVRRYGPYLSVAHRDRAETRSRQRRAVATTIGRSTMDVPSTTYTCASSEN